MGTAKGVNGTVVFDGQFVSIRSTMGRGEKRIPVGHISAVRIRPPDFWKNGAIHFTIAGGIEPNSSNLLSAGLDENAIIVNRKQMPDFEAIRSEIEAAILRSLAPVEAAPDLADQLGKLAGLRDQGVLTSAEFDAKKAELLARM